MPPSHRVPTARQHPATCQLVLPAPLSAGEEGAQASQLEPRAPEPRGFPCGAAGKEAACNEGDLGSIPGLGRSPGEGKDYPFQYSGLEDSTDYIVHGVA